MGDSPRPEGGAAAKRWRDTSLGALSRILRDGLVLLEPDGRVAYASPTASRLCGTTTPEELHELFAEWSPGIIETARAHDGAEAPVVSVERELDGHTRRLELRIVDIDEDACEGYIVVIADRAARELLDAALRRANSIESRNALLQSILHDVKAPMNAMVLNLDMLQETLKTSSDEPLDRKEALECVDVVRNEVTRLERLLATIGKTPARLETSERVRFDLRDLVRETVTLFRPQAQARRVELTPSVGSEPLLVFAFRDQISQAVINVVINAIEAMEGPGRVRVVLEDEGETAALRVVDEGPGIPPAIRELVFAAHVTTKPLGTGLGLHVTREVLTRHGGDISIQTEGGRGTRVTLRLPLASDVSSS